MVGSLQEYSHLPASSAGAGENEGSAFLGLVDELGVLQNALVQLCEPWVPMVLAWDIHGPEDTFMDVDGTCRREGGRFREGLLQSWGTGV